MPAAPVAPARRLGARGADGVFARAPLEQAAAVHFAELAVGLKIRVHRRSSLRLRQDRCWFLRRCLLGVIAGAVRGHWGIENRMHWGLDVAFREDESRARFGHAAENLAVVRHLALNLLRQERTAKLGVKAKRLKAAWDDAYRLTFSAG